MSRCAAYTVFCFVLIYISASSWIYTFCSTVSASASSVDRMGARKRNFFYYNYNGLALTPPMGWNSWNFFKCNINETVIKETADALISTGLANLGYQYVNIDDCWADWDRDSQGYLVANKSTFPSGIKALADYVHSKGLKLGIYADSGFRTCSGRMPGSLGLEEQDAVTFASWGIDYLKYDNCYNNETRPADRYLKMSRALRKTGRPIHFSMCEWGDMNPASWGADISNSWRTTDDIFDTWESMLHIADLNEVYADYAKPGGWNDPLGVQAKKVRREGRREIWAGPLSKGRMVVLFVNRRSRRLTLAAHWNDVGFKSNNQEAEARDVWESLPLMED
ncbi:Glycoside hydrolase, family 27 [Dillenia turbinata]|uniref:Alpha-galactosidase n=1 Tax=Dillenia turbinata TaxID=194707 RepID=A0AAN8VD06_9MAGN